MKNTSDIIENRTRDLPASSTVPQPAAPLRTPITNQIITYKFSSECKGHQKSFETYNWVSGDADDFVCVCVCVCVWGNELQFLTS
jgi:hypothetical protein